MSYASERASAINPDELVKGKEIGRSEFSIVYSGRYHERKVAIRELVNHHQPTPGSENDEDLDRDARIAEKCRHYAIVEFIGAVFAPGKQAIVTELCEYGSLNDAMVEHIEVFNEAMKTKCLFDVSCAMNYLHNDGIIHKDLRPQNVLITSLNPRGSDVVAKVTDIRTSRTEHRINCVISTGSGQDPFMAPEILRRAIVYDKSVDVYSFSMLMYYIFAEKIPTEDSVFMKESDPFGQIISGIRPHVPSACSTDITLLMVRCWDANPVKRPSFEQISGLLRGYWEKQAFNKEQAKTRMKARELIDRLHLDKEEVLSWTFGGGTEFNLLCELLKTNAIPTKRLVIESPLLSDTAHHFLWHC